MGFARITAISGGAFSKARTRVSCKGNTKNRLIPPSAHRLHVLDERQRLKIRRSRFKVQGSKFQQIMITPLLLSVLLQAASAPPSLAVDLDGDGVPETVSATLHGKKVRTEASDAAGQRRAHAEAAVPESGVAQIALTTGSLGRGGGLLEVS